jgi:hypothetical protein
MMSVIGILHLVEKLGPVQSMPVAYSQARTERLTKLRWCGFSDYATPSDSRSYDGIVSAQAATFSTVLTKGTLRVELSPRWAKGADIVAPQVTTVNNGG